MHRCVLPKFMFPSDWMSRDKTASAQGAPSPILASVIVALGLLQAIVLWAVGAMVARQVIGACLFLIVASETRRPWLFRQCRMQGIFLLAVCTVVNFVGLSWNSEFPISARLAQATVLVGYSMTALAGVLERTRVLASRTAWVVAAGVAVVWILTEAGLDRGLGNFAWTGGVPVVGALDGDSPGKRQFLPGTVAISTYPDPSLSHVDSPEVLKSYWRVHVTDNSGVARLEFPMARAGHLRVLMQRDSVTTPWSVELLETPLKLAPAQPYVLEFSARSSTPDSAMAKIALDVPPWDFLVTVGSAVLARRWKRFTFPFSMPAESLPVKLYFDIGLMSDTVEFSNVRVHAPSDTISVKPLNPLPNTSPHIVHYRLNANGCRGDDVPAERQPESLRVLVSGGSAAIGVGTHEGLTLATRLASALTSTQIESDTTKTTEVLNCGVFGEFGTSELPFLERVVNTYQPDAIVLAVAEHDAVSVTAESANGGIPYIRRLDRVLLTWNWVHRKYVSWKARDRVRVTNGTDFWTSDSLAAFVAAVNKPVIVLLVRLDDSPSSVARARGIAAAATRAGAMVLDAGVALRQAHDAKDLVVRPDFDLRPNTNAYDVIADTLSAYLRASLSNGIR